MYFWVFKRQLTVASENKYSFLSENVLVERKIEDVDLSQIRGHD
jgi:hypothetical protein